MEIGVLAGCRAIKGVSYFSAFYPEVVYTGVLYLLGKPDKPHPAIKGIQLWHPRG